MQYAESMDCIRINKLVLVSNSLPDAERRRIIGLFEKKTYPQGEIGERIQQAIRDMGYFKAIVHEPKFSFSTPEDRRRASVIVTVEPGAQYRLGEIRIENASVFPAAQIRMLFSLQRGEIFNPTKFSVGLDKIRSLYATQGYVDLVAVPKPIIDESHRTIDLVVVVDENNPYNFGRLYLEGVEPHPGAGKAALRLVEAVRGQTVQLA